MSEGERTFSQANSTICIIFINEQSWRRKKCWINFFLYFRASIQRNWKKSSQIIIISFVDFLSFHIHVSNAGNYYSIRRRRQQRKETFFVKKKMHSKLFTSDVVDEERRWVRCYNLFRTWRERTHSLLSILKDVGAITKEKKKFNVWWRKMMKFRSHKKNEVNNEILAEKITSLA